MNSNNIARLSFYLILLFLLACKSSPISDFKEIDLMKYGLPISILAPENVEMGKDDLGPIQGAWIKGEGYYIQIYSSDITTTDVSKVLIDKKGEVEGSAYFSKIIDEDKNGFFYEKDIDGDVRFDFRHIKILGNKEYIFQKGLIGNYSQEEVRTMYEAVRAK
jgi:hypothetical protein